MKLFLTFVICCVLGVDLCAQQDPLHAQYFNNPMLINPAFAGSNERLFIGMGYRQQWTGIEGAPVTFNFNSHVSLVDNKVGAGIIVVQDKAGEIKTTHYGGTFAYRIKFRNSTFSFGMQAGFVQYASDLKAVRVLNPDPLFVPYSETKFNTGVGLLLKGDRYTLGLSVPQLLSNRVNLGTGSVQMYSQNYYLYGGYLFNLSQQIEFKPSALLRLTKGTPISTDLNLNLTFNRLYTAGVFTRNLNTYGVLLQLVMKNVRMGYVFELPGKGSTLNFNTHEISLALSLATLRFHDRDSTGF